MPRDCTAPPFGDPTMNSPEVICRIQYNMTKRKSKQNKNAKRANNPNGLNRTRRTGGSYAPAAMGGITSKQRSALPLQAGTGRQMLVQNYELVSAYPTQDAIAVFKKSALTINPGLVATFPWLSNIALSYSKFCFKFLRFIYVPQVATNTPGVVFIDILYDSADAKPSTLQSVAQSESSSIGPAWQGGGINAEKAFRKDLGIDEMIFVDVDCSSWTQKYYYCRKNAGLDADTQPGVVCFGNDASVPALTTPGALYAAYVVEFKEPLDATTNA
nr:structural protein [Tolivirales sp.]